MIKINGVVEYWSVGRIDLNPLLHYSTTPILPKVNTYNTLRELTKTGF
jgi:hypothetical protein